MIEKKAKLKEVKTFREELEEYKKKNYPNLKDIKIKPGSAKGFIHMREDFDDPLEDFQEYM